MNGPLDMETRENLSHSHAASKSLLFTINDLLVRGSAVRALTAAYSTISRT